MDSQCFYCKSFTKPRCGSMRQALECKPDDPDVLDAYQEFEPPKVPKPSEIEPDKYKGRKPSYDRETFDTVRSMLEKGSSPTCISDITGISRQCVYRIKDDPIGCLDALTRWGMNTVPHTKDDWGEIKVIPKEKINSDGGPSDYYDFPGDWTTLNDFIEYKCKYQWLGPESFHWGNVIKALCRWGDKGGTTKEYDTKKVLYSGARVLKAILGISETRDYLQKLLDDPQFQEKE